jgi:hypothetical protein
MKRVRLVTFTVEIIVSDRWIPFEHAQRVSQPEAHRIRAAEAEIVGPHRVRIRPNHPPQKGPR